MQQKQMSGTMNTICVICYTTFLGVWLNAQVSVTDKTRLHAGALLELSGHRILERYQPMFIDMLEHVFNELVNRTDILPDYSLKLIPVDTEVFIKYFFLRFCCIPNG